MITLTRLSGTRFALNPDLIERVDSTPDSVVTLTDGTKYVVSETLDEVVHEVRLARASVVALSGRLADALDVPGEGACGRPHLAPVLPFLLGMPALDTQDAL